MDTIVQMLDELSAIRAKQAEVGDELQSRIDEILTPEMKKQIEELTTEYADKIKAAGANADELEKSVRDAVLKNGESVKGTFLHAVFSKGRVSWDNAVLDRYLKTHPELEMARKQGDSSVSIRAVKSITTR
jgi:phage host-nuclease inhibitor protein Gam